MLNIYSSSSMADIRAHSDYFGGFLLDALGMKSPQGNRVLGNIYEGDLRATNVTTGGIHIHTPLILPLGYSSS